MKRFVSLKTLGHSFMWGAALALSAVAPSFAAERLNLRFGPFEQSIEVADLEQFAQSGKVSTSLQLYTAILTPEFRKALTSRLELDPNLGTRIVEDLLKSPSGQQVLNSIRQAAPELSLETLQAGFWLAARQANQLDAIGVIKAIPQDTVTIDVTQALGIASQLNFSYWKTQGIQSLLTNSLPAGNPGFRAELDPSAPGNQPVREQFFSFFDDQRNRQLPVDLYWSSTNPQAPLIVIAPGFEANRKFLTYLARHLASHGFTVAAIEHPFVTRGGALPALNPDRLVPGTEFIDRPKDVSFLLDRFAELNQQPGELQGKLNTQKVSMIGHSLGGYEALALAGAELRIDELRDFCRESGLLERVPADWLQCAAAELPQNRISIRDPRIVQAIALNPAIGQIFGKEGLKSVATPTMILTSTDDRLAPAFTQQLQPFLQLPTPKYLLTAIGTTHLSVSDPGNFSGAVAQGTLVKERRGKEVEPLRRLLQGVTLAFVQQATPAAKTYQPFLTPDYARSLSKPELPMRLNTELPENITRWLSLASVF
ncbi:alpha/beta hydrolase [Leptolyngbya boryana CZ1]|uniref:Alpha/beta hydrolase n=1 Tax=Leptolyngbya boryana CZ1 TaxID=3060204 RepID=A0AA96WV76_LEPBY|nr:alpha/beta fold hydrolase [Leptolyngbya boryana]WNZ46561.1 alpha/beta hydrolase [Leptolyngbya boryana CZ1]